MLLFSGEWQAQPGLCGREQQGSPAPQSSSCPGPRLSPLRAWLQRPGDRGGGRGRVRGEEEGGAEGLQQTEVRRIL